MSYITASDIKSNLISGISIVDYINEADEEIKDMAEKKGVRDSTDIYSTPLHYKIKRYGVVYVLMRIAQDKYGTNTPDTTYEKYRDLYDMYSNELKDLYPQITYEMITGTVESITSRTASFGLYRS